MHLTICFAVLIFTLILTVIIERLIIPVLSGKASQPIYEGGPSWHLSKSGTPTMGGAAFILASLLTLGVASVFLTAENRAAAISVLISLIYAVANSLVGIVDDLTKIRRRDNAGLTPMQKIFLQFILAILFLMARVHYLGDSTSLVFSFGKIDLGFLYYPFAVLMLLGIVNCANLTDGIDGLAASVAFVIGIVLFFVGVLSSPDTALLSSALIGASLGFLFFNLHPAKVFMGDTGSLFLGALAVSCSFALKNPLIMVLIGGVYVIEGVSVILQVLCFKISGKRILKMAPLHHHFEKCGYGETKICVLAIILTLLLSVPAFMLYS